MAIDIKHSFVSSAPQGPDATKVRTNDWNAAHTFSGAVANQIVFGGATGGFAQSASLTWNDSTKALDVVEARLNAEANISLSFPVAAGATSDGRNISVLAQDGGATSGNGGALVFFSGNASGSGSGGSISFTGGVGGGTTSPGGSLLFTSGEGSGIGTGGDMIFNCGTGGVNADGGGMLFFGGFGGATSGGGGSISIVPGDAQTSGPGGSIFIWGGLASGTNQDGGDINLFPGEATGSGVPGYVHITGNVRNYLVENGTGAVTITAVRPTAIANATIQGWWPIKIDGVLFHTPLWN